MQSPIDGAHAVAQAAEADAAGVGAADAVVEHLDHEPVVLVLGGQPGAGGARVLGDVGQRLGDEEVGDRLGVAAPARCGQVDVDRDRHRAARGEGGDGGVQAAVGQHRRVDAAGEVAQLDERLLGLAVGLVDQPLRDAPGPRSRGRGRASWPARRAAAARRRAGRARSGGARRRRRRPCPRGSPRACPRGRSGARARPAPAAAAPSPPARRRRRATSHGAAYSAPAPNATCTTALAAKPMLQAEQLVAAPSGAQPHSGKLSSASAAPQATKTRNAAEPADERQRDRARNSSSSQEPRERIQRERAHRPNPRAGARGWGTRSRAGRRRGGAPAARARGRRRTRARSAARRAARRSASGRRPPASRRRKMNETVPSAALSAT